MCPDVWNAHLDFLPKKGQKVALFAQQEHTKMNPDKEHVNLVHQELGLKPKDLNLKQTVFQSVVMEPMDHLDWYLAWNVPKTVILEYLHLMDSKNALLVLMVCLHSNLEPMMWLFVGKNVPLDIIQKLDWLHALHALLISSNH